MAKKLKKAQYGIDPGFSKPGRNTNPVNDSGFSRPSKKDFIRGVAEGIVDSAKPKKPELKTMDDLLQELRKNQRREDFIKQLKKTGGSITALDQVQRMYSKNKK
jgi:hypothetical protein